MQSWLQSWMQSWLQGRRVGLDGAAFELVMRDTSAPAEQPAEQLLFHTARSILRGDAEVKGVIQDVCIDAWRVLRSQRHQGAGARTHADGFAAGGG